MAAVLTRPPAPTNRDKETLAKAAAEKLFATQAVQEPAPAKSSEPSLEERLAAIDRRAKDHANEEKKALAGHYLDEARRNFQRAVANTTDQELRARYEDVQRLERLSAVTAPAGGAVEVTAEGPKRVRRSAESLTGEAEKIVEYLRKHPDSKSSAVMEATGVVVKPPLNIRTFIERYLPAVKIRTEGKKAGTTYSVK